MRNYSASVNSQNSSDSISKLFVDKFKALSENITHQLTQTSEKLTANMNEIKLSLEASISKSILQ